MPATSLHSRKCLTMGCGSIKSSTSKTSSDHLLEDIQLSDGSINCMDISEDRSLLFLGDEHGIGYLLSAFSSPIEVLGKLVGHKGAISCSTIVDLFIYTGSNDKTVRKWSMETMDCLYIYEGHESKLNRILCRGDLLFTTSYDKTAKVWLANITNELREGFLDSSSVFNSCLRTLKGHTKSVYPVVFIPDELAFLSSALIHERDLVVTGSVDCSIRIWSLKHAECLKVLTDHSGPIYTIILDPLNERQFISASGDGLILVWDSITGEIVQIMKGHNGPVIALHVHKKILFSGSADKTARAWVIEFGECTRIFEGNVSGVCQIQYHKGMVCIGLCDGTANIFDSKSGEFKKTLHGYLDFLTGLKNVENRVFTCGSNGRLCVWDASGIQDDTVFNRKMVEEEDDEEDSENVKRAIKVVDKYFSH